MAEDIQQKTTLGQKLMKLLTKDYVYPKHLPEENEEPDQTEYKKPMKLKRLDDDETGAASGVPGKKKGGLIRGDGCAMKGKTKGKMR